MSVTDPLLKDLKGHAAKLLITFSTEGRITDYDPSLQPFCEILEKIFQQGLNESFQVHKPECWIWLENVASPHHKTSFAYSSSVSKAKNTARVLTDRGRFRLLARLCLSKGVLHHPVEIMLENQAQWGTYKTNSILGDEILGQIFLSVLLQCGKLKFDLNLSNALFLDETWMLPAFENLEFVPCKQLGLVVGFTGGKGAVVVKAQSSGVAAEDDKVMIGDVVTEINGMEITSATRTKLGSIMKQAEGQPIQLSVLRARQTDGKIFPPIQRLLLRLGLHLEIVDRNRPKSKEKQDNVIGFPVEYMGSVLVGAQGDVSKICTGITKVVAEPQTSFKVQMEILEMGVKVTATGTNETICNHTFMEISSCGKYERLPEYFAYIAGDSTSCNTSSEFYCFIFRSGNHEDIANILYSIAQGFQRTHWAV
ncbi:Hypothetical predicted protein [Cloeon dipterum]|uniref:PDZ domain-containing protein n=1 Tax=Cloeon dipterum TaxID=197152 RepID=A0A8S1CT05_9INSE|nr:Hypothetical predicted protein [Cloeon dipterum]